jgi:hypothetical protein
MHEAWVFFVEVGFEVHRRLIAEGDVEPLRVIKHFDPFKDGSLGLGPRGELAAVNQFAQKALGHNSKTLHRDDVTQTTLATSVSGVKPPPIR